MTDFLIIHLNLYYILFIERASKIDYMYDMYVKYM